MLAGCQRAKANAKQCQGMACHSNNLKSGNLLTTQHHVTTRTVNIDSKSHAYAIQVAAISQKWWKTWSG